MKFLNVAAVVAFASVSFTAQAELYGNPNGRLADLSQAAPMSVELAFATGDVGDDVDYQNIGGRFNYKSSDLLVVYGDVSMGEADDFDGMMFGFGAYYQLDGILNNADTAVKGSFHTGELENSPQDLDVQVISFETLISGRNALGNNGNLFPYGNIGIHRIKSKRTQRGFTGSISDSDTEIGFGGGVVLKTATGEFYGGIDLIDELTFGIGFRYNL